MSYSAANSHQMVSEPRLLMSLLQDDLMGDVVFFDPSLPPVFDVNHDEHVEIVKNKVVHEVELLPIYKEYNAEFEKPKLVKKVQWIWFNPYSKRNMVETTFPSIQTTTVSYVGSNVLGHEGLNDTIDVCLNIRVCDWNQPQTSKVFNPGILTTKGEHISQPLSQHWKAQELGQFFLKKGRMIRIQMGRTTMKVGNQFGSFPRLLNGSRE